MKGVPTNLPTIPLYDSAETPPHSLPHSDYPFAPNGSYVTSWAAEGGVNPEPASTRGSHHGDDSSSSSRKKTTSSSKSKNTTSTKKSSGSSSANSTPSKSKGKSSGGGSKHTVKSSDSLYSIAKKYGTTVAKLKAANGLKGDNIRDGAKLTIP